MNTEKESIKKENDEEKGSKKRNTTGIFRLLEIAGTKKYWLIAASIFSVISTIALFVPFYSIYEILKELAYNAKNVSNINEAFIWHWAWISLYGVIIYVIMMYAALLCSHIAAFNILYELRIKIAQKLPNLNLGYFSKKTSGGIKKIMTEDVERIELFIAHHIPDYISSLVYPLILTVWLFVVDWRLAIITTFLLFIAVYIQFTMITKGRKEGIYEEYFGNLAKMNSSVVEFVRAIQIFKVFNLKIATFDKLEESIQEYSDNRKTMSLSFINRYVLSNVLIFCPIILIISFGMYFWQASSNNLVYLGKFFFFLVMGVGISYPLIKLQWVASYMQQNLYGVGIIDELLELKEIESVKDTVEFKNYDIEFDAVDFKYENKDIYALKNVSFYAKTGTITGLVGPSGAGKSTTALLLARFFDINKGVIKIGGIDIKNIPMHQLMDSISFVFQDNMLFYETIEENIRIGNNKATHEQVIEAAKAAQCHDFIEKLENGYQTKVGEGGTYLSGGETQRIAIARAILKDAPIIILDEATAYADPENESKILNAFSHLIRNKTVLVIAHRLSTITEAHQILVFDNAKIVEQGTHDQLVHQDKMYAHLWHIFSRTGNWQLNRNS